MEKNGKIGLYSFIASLVVVGVNVGLTLSDITSAWDDWTYYVDFGVIGLTVVFAIYAKATDRESILATASLGFSLFFFLFTLETMLLTFGLL